MFAHPSLSLTDLFGAEYMRGMCAAAAFSGRLTRRDAENMALEPVDLYPEDRQQADEKLAGFTGMRIAPPFRCAEAVPQAVMSRNAAGMAIGEDGCARLCVAGEWGEDPFGGAFPGYRLAEYARRLGMSDTRGYASRCLERQAAPDGQFSLFRTRREAMEKAVALLLSRFYRYGEDDARARYAGLTPVFLTDDAALCAAWPEISRMVSAAAICRVLRVDPGDPRALDDTLRRCDRATYKPAGLFLTDLVSPAPDQLWSMQRALAASDTPLVVDATPLGGRLPDVKASVILSGGGMYVPDNPADHRVLGDAGDCASLRYLLRRRFLEENAREIGQADAAFEAGVRALSTRGMARVVARGRCALFTFPDSAAADLFLCSLRRLHIDAARADDRTARIAPNILTPRAVLDFLLRKLSDTFARLAAPDTL